jgi:serine/threonine-protein kinase
VQPHDPSLASTQPGQILAGKFRVDRVLGQGGFGVVVAATHLHLNERVALKFLLPSALQNPQLVGRFLREAQAAVRIKSEHVARVSDVGQLPTGEPYMVMEYLHGQDLAGHIEQHGPLPPQQAASFLLQALEAIAEAHSLGIVHRDLKPANLFLTRRADGSTLIKVLDFGISKMASEGQGGLTATGAIMGSPYYMSPEQLTDMKLVDVRSDIWSLGVVFFELVTGKIPFPDDGQIGQLVAAILTKPPCSVRQLRPDLRPEIDALVQRCLQKQQDARFQNVGQLAEALAPLAGEEGRVSVSRITSLTRGSSVGLEMPAPPATSTHAATSELTSAVTRQVHPPKKSRVPLFVGLAVAVLLGAGGLALFASSRQDTTGTQPLASLPLASATTSAPSAVPAAASSAASAASAAPAASVGVVVPIESLETPKPETRAAGDRKKPPTSPGTRAPEPREPKAAATKPGDTGRKDW